MSHVEKRAAGRHCRGPSKLPHYTVPLTNLAKLAAGNKSRWRERRQWGDAQKDLLTCQLELWYKWAAQRTKLYIATYCPKYEQERDTHRTTIYQWFESKLETLEKAGAACEVSSSERLLPIDIADQVVRRDQASASAHRVSS